MEKTYEVPEDVAIHFDRSTAAFKIRDLAIKLPFGYKKAMKAAVESEKQRRIFWKKVRNIFPEIKDNTLKYNQFKQTIEIVEEKNI